MKHCGFRDPPTIADKEVDAKFCITGGTFGHDKYAVKIGWSRVVEGVDDETTKGISGTYKGHVVGLICMSQNQPPNKDGEPAGVAMAKSMEGRPEVTPEQAHDMAVRM